MLILRRRRANGEEQVRLRRIHPDGSGDELLHDSTRGGLHGGPILRAGAVWFKSADGTITMLDLESRRPVRSIPAGISIPDALAVAPDGRTLATLCFDEKIFPTLVEVRDG